MLLKIYRLFTLGRKQDLEITKRVVWTSTNSTASSVISASWRRAPTGLYTVYCSCACAVLHSHSESIATLPPFGPIEGQKWFDKITSQWKSQKNRFAFISFGKIQFLPPCIWNLPFMSYHLGGPVFTSLLPDLLYQLPEGDLLQVCTSISVLAHEQFFTLIHGSSSASSVAEFIWSLTELQRHNTENSKQIFSEKELHIQVSASNFYIPTIGLPILLQKNMWTDPWECINCSQTHECGNWDWGRAIPFRCNVGDKVNSGPSATVCSLACRYNNPMPEWVDFIPQSGIYEFGYLCYCLPEEDLQQACTP